MPLTLEITTAGAFGRKVHRDVLPATATANNSTVKMGFRGNNVLHRNHFRKDWQRFTKVNFDQPGQKKSRRTARAAKALKGGLRPTELLRPAVRCPTVKYNRRLRAGRGFSLAELKAAKINKKEALGLGIPVDHRRRNLSEEGLKLNVDRLTAYKERLVVLPRKTKRGLKQEKPTVSEETTVRSLAALFPIPAGTVAEEPRELTAAEKEVNAYTALRTARSNARLAGIRAVRQKKKDEDAAAAKK